MLIRARYSATASHETGASGTRMSSTCDGKWVKTIVFSRPMRSASQPATSNDSPDSTPTQKKSTASVVASNPQRKKNQYETNDWTTKPPANASRPKRTDSLPTVPAERWIPMNLRSPSTFASSTLSLNVTNT